LMREKEAFLYVPRSRARMRPAVVAVAVVVAVMVCKFRMVCKLLQPPTAA